MGRQASGRTTMHVDQWFWSPFPPPPQVFYSYYKVNNTLNKFSHCMLLFIVSETLWTLSDFWVRSCSARGAAGCSSPKQASAGGLGVEVGYSENMRKKGYTWPCDTDANLALSCWHLSTYYFPMTPWFTYLENSKDSHCSVSSDGYRED